ALAEFERVLELGPRNTDATLYLHHILNNHNILGLPRDIDIIPDFRRYEQVIADYGPMIQSLFATAINLLDGNILLDHKRRELVGEVAHLQTLIGVLEIEAQAADAGVQSAQAEVVLADARIQDVKGLLDAKDAELQNATFTLGGFLTDL